MGPQLNIMSAFCKWENTGLGILGHLQEHLVVLHKLFVSTDFPPWKHHSFYTHILALRGGSGRSVLYIQVLYLWSRRSVPGGSTTLASPSSPLKSGQAARLRGGSARGHVRSQSRSLLRCRQGWKRLGGTAPSAAPPTASPVGITLS